MGSLTHDWETMTHGVGALLAKRDVVRVFGADATKFLQTQVSQDVSTLQPGESRWSFLLEPKGRVDALMRVWGRHGESEILIDVDDGSGARVVDRLNRFRIRTKVEIEVFAWDWVLLCGPQSEPALAKFHPELQAEIAWPGFSGFDLIGPELELPDGITEISSAAVELARIESGWPDMSHEISPDVNPAPIPGELGELVVDSAVSFTKGCYTGQELVVRTRSRGDNTPRRLSRIRVDDPGDMDISAVLPGTVIEVAGEDCGVVTSLAQSPTGDWSGLGLIKRKVSSPVTGRLVVSDPATEPRAEVRVDVLPPVDTVDVASVEDHADPGVVPL